MEGDRAGRTALGVQSAERCTRPQCDAATAVASLSVRAMGELMLTAREYLYGNDTETDVVGSALRLVPVPAS